MTALLQLDSGNQARSANQRPLRGARGSWMAWALASLVILIVYVWYVSVGYWTWWPKTTYTYDLLGSAFRAGQLSLQQAPDPALLDLPNPYDPAARANLQYPWDSSLYEGRFYLYWGPTPGLLLAAIKLVYAGQVADQYLVFAFVLAAYIFSSMLVLELWKRHFPSVPAALGCVSFLALGLAGPSTWLLNRPAGYEAAISGGQALLASGLFFAVTGLLDERPRRGHLVLAGACWALALGSRIATLFPVAILSILILFRIKKLTNDGRAALGAAVCLLAPLLAGSLALAWYNWARFGSIWEFGLRYQLTLLDLHAMFGRAFSIQYLPDNLYNYVLNSIRTSRTFPFLSPLAPARLPPGPALIIPAVDLEPVTGLLISAPFLGLAVLPLAVLLAQYRVPSGNRGENRARSGAGSPYWLYFGLLTSAAASFLFILVYFYPTERQLEDVVPLLAVLAVFGLWEVWRVLQARRLPLVVASVVSVGLIVASIIASSLLAVTSYENRFQHLNRDLLRELIRFFGR